MKVSECIALALVSAALQACSARSASDDAEGPYAEEADLLSICAQRPLHACETADELCDVLRALPIDVDLGCSRPSAPVACVPAPAANALADADADVDVAVCRVDVEGNAWAIGSLDAPPDWRPLAAQAPAEWQNGCEAIAHCED